MMIDKLIYQTLSFDELEVLAMVEEVFDSGSRTPCNTQEIKLGAPQELALAERRPPSRVSRDVACSSTPR